MTPDNEECKECETCEAMRHGLFFTERLYCGEKHTGQMEEVSPVDSCESWISQKKADVAE